MRIYQSGKDEPIELIRLQDLKRPSAYWVDWAGWGPQLVGVRPSDAAIVFERQGGKV